MRRALDRLFQFYWGEGIADDVPALAYYLVLSLAPFALGVAAVALRLDDALTALSVAAQINRYLPEQVHGDVERLVVGTRESSPELLIVADRRDALDDVGRDRRHRALPLADARRRAPPHRARPHPQHGPRAPWWPPA